MNKTGLGKTPDEMRPTLADLLGEARALRKDVRDRFRATLVFAVLVLAFVVGLGVMGWQNRQIARQNQHISEQIADCTTEGGECQKQGAKRTGAALQQILRAQIHLDLCQQVPGVDTAAEIERCVVQRMAAEKPVPTPSGR